MYYTSDRYKLKSNSKINPVIVYPYSYRHVPPTVLNFAIIRSILCDNLYYFGFGFETGWLVTTCI